MSAARRCRPLPPVAADIIPWVLVLRYRLRVRTLLSSLCFSLRFTFIPLSRRPALFLESSSSSSSSSLAPRNPSALVIVLPTVRRPYWGPEYSEEYSDLVPLIGYYRTGVPSPPKAVVTTVRSPECPKVGSPQPKENIFFFGAGGNPVKCGRGSGLLNFKSIFGSLVVHQTLARNVVCCSSSSRSSRSASRRSSR